MDISAIKSGKRKGIFIKVEIITNVTILKIEIINGNNRNIEILLYSNFFSCDTS